jgi:hypothetical protein
VWSFLKTSVVIHNPFLYPGTRPSIVYFFIFLSWSQIHCNLLVNREFISVTEMVFLIVCKMFVSFSFFFVDSARCLLPGWQMWQRILRYPSHMFLFKILKEKLPCWLTIADFASTL